jgi:hypothetical protein
MENSIRIVHDSSASQELWTEVASACQYATFFHTPEWADIFFKYSAGRIRPCPRIVTFEDNRSAIIPLSCKQYLHGTFNCHLSSPAGTFGGWISRDNLTPLHTRALVDYMLKRDNVAWRENPYDPFLNTITLPGATEEFTQVIDLTQDASAVHNAASRAHAKALRKARREGVVIREADGISDWERHFKAYELSLVRWEKAGTRKKRLKPYTWDLFKIIFEKKPMYRKLWCACYKGSIAASVLCFYWNNHAVAWHGAALEEFFSVRPNNLLYQHMIDHAREMGYRWFDCNTPGGLKGVIEFKDNLGTLRLKSRFLNKVSKRRKFLQRIKQVF